MGTESARALRINAIELLRQPGATKPIRSRIDGVDLDVDHRWLAGAIDIDVELEALNDGIVVRGEVAAPWQAPCRRCLAELAGSAIADVDELYQVVVLDEDASPIVDGQLDLAPMVRQSVLLELDEERLCRPDCAGLCPQCGVDRNEESCGCSSEIKDDRWSALEGLVLDD